MATARGRAFSTKNRTEMSSKMTGTEALIRRFVQAQELPRGEIPELAREPAPDAT